MGIYVRVCQECGHAQEAKDPRTYKGEGWLTTKCRKCRSESLDYGHDQWERNSEGKLVRIESDDEDMELMIL